VAGPQPYLINPGQRVPEAEWYRRLRLATLQAVAAGPLGWVQSREDRSEWRPLHRLVDSMAETLLQELNQRLGTSFGVTNSEVEWWALACRVAEESTFRLHAVHLSRLLLQLYRREPDRQEELNRAETVWRQAQNRYERWHAQRETGPREQDQGGTAIIRSGDSWRGEQTLVSAVRDRPEVRIEYAPELRGVRFYLDSGEVEQDRGVDVHHRGVGSDGESVTEIRYRDWRVTLSWNRQSRRLRLRVGASEVRVLPS
jgi:hypothetical protein